MFLWSKIQRLIDELGVTIIERDGLDTDGHYIAELNTIVLRSTLDEIGKICTLLHELGHACQHQHNYELYRITFALHSKMEYQADYYMIEQLLDSYMSLADLKPIEVNYVKFLDDMDLDYSHIETVKKILSDLIQPAI
ncbi:zinc metallopeptidase [Enterococcus faecalis]|nr:ImmA/IrrE family metallo-endopeptidase [Enterococcus faecalis]QHN68826.1 zinc metallopeptidase [Enterococcus faecalis]QUE60599.1 zinc metallopeptidase [Enterococcus faecalis]HCT1846153.1 zinc metallopeptidase [Enterococcus faecalis]HDT8076032.1 zinc metallopeptidase [Enterococcus faecalis]